jgi:hypothetical protein
MNEINADGRAYDGRKGPLIVAAAFTGASILLVLWLAIAPLFQ